MTATKPSPLGFSIISGRLAANSHREWPVVRRQTALVQSLISTPLRTTSTFESVVTARLLSQPIEPSTQSPAQDCLGGGTKTEGLAIVWLRNELRLHDHPAMVHACKNYSHVLPVLVLNTDQHKVVNGAMEALSIAEQDLFCRSIEELERDLVARGGHLLILKTENADDVAGTLGHLFVQLGGLIRGFIYHKGFSSVERQEEARVITAISSAIAKRNQQQTSEDEMTITPMWANTLYEWDLLSFNDANGLPDNCDDFSDLVSRVGPPKEPLPTPEEIPCPTKRFLLDLGVEGCKASQILSKMVDNASHGWLSPGERGAAVALRNYIEGKSLGSKFTSSSLSPPNGLFNALLSWGCISPKTIFHSVAQALPTMSIRRHCAELDLLLRDFQCFSQFRTSLSI